MPDITEMLRVNTLQSWTITWWQAMSTHCTLSNPTGPCFSPFHLSYVCAFRPLVATCPIRMQQRKKRNDLDNLRAPFYRHVPNPASCWGFIRYSRSPGRNCTALNFGPFSDLESWGVYLTGAHFWPLTFCFYWPCWVNEVVRWHYEF